MTLDQITNFARGAVIKDVAVGDTTIAVDTVESFPDPTDTDAGGSYKSVIFDGEYDTATDDPDSEIVTVTSIDNTNNTLTVERGKENTTVSTHPKTAVIYNAYTAAFRDDVQQEIEDIYNELYDSATRLYVTENGDDSASGTSERDGLATVSEAMDRIRSARQSLPAGAPPEPVTVYVESGIRFVDNPIVMPAKVSIMADNLRSSVWYPQHPKRDFIHSDNLCHLWGIRFRDHQSPAFTISFPRAIADPQMAGDSVNDIQLLYSPDGYLEGNNNDKPTVVIDPPRNGTQASAEVTINDGKITDVTVTDPGSGYQTKPTVSIPAPQAKQPFVIGSPYPLNCSTITGPFDENGKKIPPTVPLPYDTSGFSHDGETYAAVDPEGAGGGMLIDGRLCFGRNEMTNDSPRPKTPLNSMVAAQFTQVNQGGPGHLVINGGFAQFVSMFTTFSTYSFKTKTGGLALCSNSVTDFGIEGLVAEGRDLNPYTEGNITSDESSSVAAVNVDNGGSGYSNPTVTVDPPTSGTQAEADAVVDNGEIISVTVTTNGDGYETTPNVSVSGNGTGAKLSVEMNKVGTVYVDNLDQFTRSDGKSITRRPEVNSVIEINGEERTIESWGERNNGEYSVSFRPGIFSVTSGTNVSMYELSNVNSGGHVFEYPGTGVTYNSLPEYGGIPDLSQMTKEFGTGRVYHTSSDNYGNFYVGSQFQVNQQTGEVTLNTDQFNLSGLNAVGPFSVNGVTRGVQLREVTNRQDLVANSGLDGNAVPTVSAVRSYFLDQNRTVPDGGTQGQALVKSSNNDRDTQWDTVAYPSDIDDHRANEVHDKAQPPQDHGGDTHTYTINVEGSPIGSGDKIEFFNP